MQNRRRPRPRARAHLCARSAQARDCQGPRARWPTSRGAFVAGARALADVFTFVAAKLFLINFLLFLDQRARRIFDSFRIYKKDNLVGPLSFSAVNICYFLFFMIYRRQYLIHILLKISRALNMVLKWRPESNRHQNLQKFKWVQIQSMKKSNSNNRVSK